MYYPGFLFVSRVISSSSAYIQYRDDLLQISRTTHQSTSQRRHSISQLIVYHRARTTSIWETKKVFRYIKGGRAHLDCHQRRLYEYEMDRAAQGFFLPFLLAMAASCFNWLVPPPFLWASKGGSSGGGSAQGCEIKIALWLAALGSISRAVGGERESGFE